MDIILGEESVGELATGKAGVAIVSGIAFLFPSVVCKVMGGRADVYLIAVDAKGIEGRHFSEFLSLERTFSLYLFNAF